MRHRSIVSSCTHITEIISQNIKIDFKPMKITFYFQKIFQFSNVVSLNTSWLSVCKQIAMVRKSYRGFSHCLWNYQYWRRPRKRVLRTRTETFRSTRCDSEVARPNSMLLTNLISEIQGSWSNLSGNFLNPVPNKVAHFDLASSLQGLSLKLKCIDTVKVNVKTTSITFGKEWRISHSISANPL